MEILLVEDGLLDAQITLAALTQCHIHHRVTLIRTVREAIQFLSKQAVFARAPSPDLVLLDLLLLDGEGHEVLQFIRQTTDIEDTPVVILTASTDYEDRVACNSLTVDDYILKPFDVGQFLRVVRENRRLHIHDGPIVAT